MTAQMLPEELERLKILSERFKYSLPTEEELQKYMDIADELSDAQHRQADLSIPVENQKCLARLKELFGSGMPSDSVLDACEQAQHDRDVLKQSRAVHGFSESEQQQYEALKRTLHRVCLRKMKFEISKRIVAESQNLLPGKIRKQPSCSRSV